MGFLKKLGKIVNKVTDFAAPALGYIPGIGPIAAGGADFLGDLAGGQNWGKALKSGLKTGGSAYVGGKIGGVIKNAVGGSAAARNAANAAATGAKIVGIGPGGVPMMNAANPMTAAAGGGGWMDKLGDIGGALIPKNKAGGTDWRKLIGDIGKVALPAAGAYQASKAAGKADEYRKRAIDLATGEWNKGAPLRDLGMSGMLDPKLAEIGGIFNQPRPQYRRISV